MLRLASFCFYHCSTKQCDLVHGECVQTFTPYLFLVIPLGPVTLTGQDYVMVESGCTCRPKYAVEEGPDPMDVIPNFRYLKNLNKLIVFLTFTFNSPFPFSRS